MAQRREKGSGSVYFDGERDRWRGEVRVDGRRHKVSAKTKTEAQRKLRELTAKRDTGQVVNVTRVTVSEAVADFRIRSLPNRRSKGRPLAPGTLEAYRWALDIIDAELGKVKLADLTTRRIEQMLATLSDRRGVDKGDRPMSVASLRKVLGALQRVIRFQVRYGVVDRNVADVAELPPTATQEARRQALAPDTARRLLGVLSREHNGAMFALSLRLGLRPGEAAGLYWCDIDGDKLNVTRGLRRAGGRLEISDDLKTTESKRTIQMPADMTQMFNDLRAAINDDDWSDDQLVFASPTGRPLDPKQTRAQLAAICTAAEIWVIPMSADEAPRPPRPNELRHSCASLLADEGWPNEQIADLLGHTTTRMVDATYRHRLRPVVDVAARATWAN